MKRITPALRLSALAAAVCAANTFAQEGRDQSIEETVVWGTQVRASSVSLGEDEIAIRQADHLSDLLRVVPGVDVGGAHSLNQRITIRSLGDRNLRISIDGANQNTYMYHHMGNLQIHSNILRSVDIDVGTNSVVDGGLGGAVRFETKDAADFLGDSGRGYGAALASTYADNNYYSYSLTGYAQVSDSVDVLAYYHYLDKDNYEVGGGRIEDQNGNEIPGTKGEVEGQDGEIDNMLFKLGWNFAPGQRLQLSYEGYQDEGDYSYRPDMGLATDIAIGDSLGLPLTYDTEFSRDTLVLKYDLEWGAGSSLSASLYANESELKRDERAISAIWPEDPSFVEGRAENSGLNVLAYSPLGADHHLTYGVDIIDWETAYRPDGEKLSGEEATSSALFLQDRYELGAAFALIGGLRYEYYEIDGITVDDDYDALNAALAAEWSPLSSLVLKLSTTQFFQGPELAEVFIGAGYYDTPNPDIDAQGGYNSEFSVAYEESFAGLGRISGGFTLFQTRIEDYIYEYATAPADIGASYWKDNVGDMQIDGIEAYAGYALGAFSALLTYSTSESDLDASTGYADLDGARIDREQGDTFSLLLDYAIPEWGLSFHWDSLWVDDLGAGEDLDGPTLDNSKEGYDVHNISARWSSRDIAGLSLTLGVDNVFDEYYSSQSSRTGISVHPRFGELQLTDYEPGRNVKATLAYQF